MRTLIAATEDSIIIARTKLDATALKGSDVVLTLLNTEGVTDGCAACIGLRGSETAELRRLAVSSSVKADLTMDHVKGEWLEVMRYDSRRFYGSATETGTYSLIATVPIDVDDPQGTRYEYTGTLAWFKATYYDSSTGDETPVADAEAIQGDQSARYCAIDKIRSRAGMARNNYVQDDRFASARTRAESEIDSTLAGVYVLPLTSTPAIITEICELLASGTVMSDEFGEGEGADGPKKQAQARSMLKDIREGKLKLIADGAELPKASASLPVFYPTALSADDEYDPTAPKMPRNKVY
jgi:phage gp36-like protein